MSPRPIRVPAYAFWVLVVLATGGPVGSILASTKIANNNLAEAQLAQVKTREEGRQRTCDLFRALLATYDETPPTTPTSANIRATYLEFYNLNRCQPPRK